jgi:hypothetical protein
MDDSTTDDTPTPAPDVPTKAPDVPNIRRLSRMQVGPGQAARLVAAILHAADPEDVKVGIARLCDACLVTEWTVYRWLRGTHDPTRRRRQWELLLTTAESFGITLENLPPAPPAVEVPEADAAAVDAAPGNDLGGDTLEDAPTPAHEAAPTHEATGTDAA